MQSKALKFLALRYFKESKMSQKISSVLLFSIALFGSSAAIAQNASSDPAKAAPISANAPAVLGQEERYRIGYRDKLTVQVFRHPELTQTVSVDPNGTISLFRIDDPIVAVCKTDRELAKEIEAAYRKDYLKKPEVNVTVAEQMSQAVSVVDAVVKPGPFFLNRKVHLWELIAMAGGPSKEAGSRVIVARLGSTSKCGQEVTAAEDQANFSSFKISELQEGKSTFMIQPGDIVAVQKVDLIFVYGNVVEPGQVEMRQPMTLRQAIASAKGLKAATDKSKVRIIRQKLGSEEPEEIVVDLNAVNKQKATDPYLQPNDIVALSEDRAKSILNSVTRTFTQGLPTLVRPY